MGALMKRVKARSCAPRHGQLVDYKDFAYPEAELKVRIARSSSGGLSYSPCPTSSPSPLHEGPVKVGSMWIHYLHDGMTQSLACTITVEIWMICARHATALRADGGQGPSGRRARFRAKMLSSHLFSTSAAYISIYADFLTPCVVAFTSGVLAGF
ncbi:hypothetical protein DENSPDRAFT_521685 [Dentipellis sp. KUC8613]|nr:hypothetical protein DENSPDRAFT_521685 [Dentipellis sp. KUC8613]